MTIETTDQFRVVRSAPYDGTNGEEILAEFGGVLVSDTGTLLTFTAAETEYEVAIGDRVFWGGPDAFEEVRTGLRIFPWAILPMTGLAYKFTTVTGSGAIPASLLGAAQNITVNLAPVAGGDGAVLSGTNYTPHVSMRGFPNILSGHAVATNGVLPLSATQVRVTVQSGAASLAGGSVFVVAQQLQIA